MNERQTEELLARARRTETRITQLMIGLGIQTNAQRPEFDEANASLRLPSPHSSIKEILDSIPAGCVDPVTVYIGDEKLITLRR